MAAPTRPRTQPDVPSTRRWGVSAMATALVVLVGALVLGGGGTGAAVSGLDDPGGLTRWGLPVAKVVLNGASAVAVGLLALAAMLPSHNGELAGDALRALRAAANVAIVWAAAAVVVHLLTLSDLVGQPVWDAVAGNAFASYTSSVAQGQAYATVVVLALALVPTARLTLGRGGAIAVLCLGIGALIPPGLIGHASTGDYHHSARTSLLIHLVGMALWVGGLVAVTWYAAHRGPQLSRMARAYSALALGCFVMVGASGVVNAWVRIPSLTDLVTTWYGALVLAKAAALVALGAFGATHRRRTLRDLDAGRSAAFRRLAAGEVVVMGTALALAVALSRTPPPVPDDAAPASAVRDLLGFPAAPEAGRPLAGWAYRRLAARCRIRRPGTAVRPDDVRDDHAVRAHGPAPRADDGQPGSAGTWRTGHAGIAGAASGATGRERTPRMAAGGEPELRRTGPHPSTGRAGDLRR